MSNRQLKTIGVTFAAEAPFPGWPTHYEGRALSCLTARVQFISPTFIFHQSDPPP
jgi:hypothetical protein